MVAPLARRPRARRAGASRGRSSDALTLGGRPGRSRRSYFTGWLPGYADPEYFLRLLFQSDSRTNEGGFSHPPFDELIERARQERSDRARLRLFHEADRMAVADRVAVIPLVYGRSMAFVKPWVHGWWEFGKSSASVRRPAGRPGLTAEWPGQRPGYVSGSTRLVNTSSASASLGGSRTYCRTHSSTPA